MYANEGRSFFIHKRVNYPTLAKKIVPVHVKWFFRDCLLLLPRKYIKNCLTSHTNKMLFLIDEYLSSQIKNKSKKWIFYLNGLGRRYSTSDTCKNVNLDLGSISVRNSVKCMFTFSYIKQFKIISNRFFKIYFIIRFVTKVEKNPNKTCLMKSKIYKKRKRK